ncbi:MAG: hypothetical protein HYV29_14480 [Ignavibacteriales bacterium]|nr:hypothetical protein [Ignavibacteriales bacterium]
MKSLSFFFVFFSFFSQAQQLSTGILKERPVPRIDTPFALIDFADSVHGCLFSQNGDYITTTDGGMSWSSVKKLQSATKIVKVSLLNKNVVVIDEMNYLPPLPIKLHVSTDFGQTWIEKQLIDSVLSSNGRTISLLNDSIIGFLDWKGNLYKSTNLGTSWDTVPRPEQELFSTLSIFDSSDYLICGGGGFTLDGFVRRSTDGGKSWNEIFYINQLATADAEFYTSSLGYLWETYGDEPERGRSILFNPKTNESIILDDIRAFGALYDNGEYFLLSISHGLYKVDNDSSYYIGPWQSGDLKIKQFTTVGKEFAWILSDSGRVFQRTDLLTKVGKNRSAQYHQPENYISIRTYPNPFNGSCNIEVNVRHPLNTIQIIIYDVLGRRQKILYEGYLFAGVHNLKWDGKNNHSVPVSSGAYSIVLHSSNIRQIKTLLYLK